MPVKKEKYAPRPLATPREYPGYQFYAVLRLKDRTAGECLCCAALTIQNWLCERIRSAGGDVPEELCRVPADRFAEVGVSQLRSVDLADNQIISLPDRGVWTLTVREPHPEIPARSFVTHAGLRSRGAEEVEFGVRIDIVDRDGALAEQDRAYRPQFVRLLFEMEGMTLSQAGRLPFREAVQVGDKRGIAKLRALADDRANQFPLIAFTYAKQRPEDLPDLSALLAETTKGGGLPFWPEHAAPRGPVPAPGRSATQPKAPGQAAHALPCDAEEFAKHMYGFARVFIVEPQAFAELRARFGRARLNEGDILIVEPKAFGGQVKTLPWREGLSARWYAKITEELNRQMQCYSKRKPYDFGGVLFEDGARQLVREEELEALRASIHLEKGDEVRRVLDQLDREHRMNAELTRQIEALRTAMQEEYFRGAQSERHRAEQLEARLNGTRADNAGLRSKIENMQKSFAQFSAVREIAERVQSVARMPKTNEDVVAWFQLMFADRIDFTKNGRKTAAECDINPEMLWKCLHQAATVLVKLYRDREPDIEKKFRELTGWELAFSEGSETRKNPDLMDLRRDEYQGRAISIEPHIKFPRSLRKTGAHYQRLYYAYDAETGRIVVGSVGDHIENYTSLSVH